MEMLKLSFIIPSMVVCLNEGMASEPMLIRRRSVNRGPYSNSHLFTYFRRKLEAYYDEKEDDTFLLKREMEIMGDGKSDEFLKSLPEDDYYTTSNSESVRALICLFSIKV